jgi:WD40 repeat protein
MSAAILPPAAREDLPAAACPYRGLMPFREADAPYFFGRTRRAGLVRDNLVSSRLTLFYAPSGVGKSSLLLAGVVPELSAGARASVAAGAPAGHVPVVLREWSGDALVLFEGTLRAQCEPLLSPGVAPPAGEGDLTALLAAWATALDSTLLLILDQFEEFLLYHGHDWDSPDGAAPQVAAAMRAPELQANFLIAMREDAVASLDLLKGRVPHLFDNRLGLGRLDREAGSEAIVKPIGRWNGDHPAESAVEIEDELVDAVLEQVTAGAIDVGRAGALERSAEGTIEAPYLQLVMTRIWDEERAAKSNRLRLATLDALGGATQIVRSHVDLQLDRLTDADKDIAAAAFDRLVTPSGAKIALTAGDLAAWTGITPKPLQRVLDGLAQGDRRIVRAIADQSVPGAPRSYEIFHDTLGEAVLDWRSRHLAQRKADALVAEAQREARRRWRRRVRRTLLVIGAVVGLVIATLAAIALRKSSEARNQARISQAGELAAAARVQQDADPELSVLLAREALRMRPEDPEPAGALRAALAAYPARGVLQRGTLPVRDVEPFRTPDRILAWGDDGHLRVWSMPGGHKVFDVEASASELTGARVSPDDRRVVTSAADGAVATWDARNGRRLRTLREPGGHAADPRWDATGRRVLARVDDTAWIWSSGGRRLAILRIPGTRIAGAEWRPGSPREVVTTSSDGAARLWDATHARAIRTLTLGKGLRGLVVAASGDVAAGLGTGAPTELNEPVAHLFDLRDRRAVTLHALLPELGGVHTAAFDHAGARLATAGFDRRVRIWKTADGTLENVLSGSGADVVTLAYSPDDTTIATGGIDGTVRLWNADSGDQLAVLRGHQAAISGIAFLPGKLITAGDDGQVRVWALHEAPARSLTPRSIADQLAFSRDGRQLFLATADGVETLAGSRRFIKLRGGANIASPNRDATLVAIGSAWDGNPGAPALVLRVRDGARVGRPLALPRHNGAVTAVFSPDDKLILTTHRDGAARLWDAQTHRVLRRLGPSLPLSRDLALVDGRFSGDGRQAATVGRTGVVRVFDVRTGREVRTFVPPPGAGQGLNAVAFQPQGHLLATVGVNGNARLWNLRTGDKRDLPSDDADVGVTFSPGGGLLVTSSVDGTARLWDARTGEQLTVLERTPAPVVSVAFSPDGRHIAAADVRPRVNMLDCEVCRPTAELLALARRRVPRDLTADERRAYVGGSDG